MLGTTRVCARAVLRTQWTDGGLPAPYRGEAIAVVWRKRFQSIDMVRTFSKTSGLDDEWKNSAIIHNLTSVQNVIEPYEDAAPKMFIATCATVICVMTLFGTLLVFGIRRFHNCASTEQANPAPP